MMNGMNSHEYRGNHLVHERAELAEKKVVFLENCASADAEIIENLTEDVEFYKDLLRSCHEAMCIAESFVTSGNPNQQDVVWLLKQTIDEVEAAFDAVEIAELVK